MASRERMSAVDAAWLHMDRPTNLMVINAVTWLDAPVDWEAVAKIVEERLVRRFPRFRQRVVESALPFPALYWEDDPHFSVEHHIHHVALPAPGGTRALQSFVGDLMSVPLDRTKPLWHMYFVDGYGEGCAAMTRIHHCVGDGVALARVLLALSDEWVAGPDLAAAARPAERPQGLTGLLGTLTRPTAAGVRAADAMVHEGIEVLTHPSKLRDIAALGHNDTAALAKLTLTPPDARTVFRGPGVVSKRAVWAEPLPLTDVQAIGRPVHATVNDVLLSAVSGAIGRYLDRRGGRVDNLRTFIPFNIRPPDQPLPATLGNKFGLIFLDLPVGIRDPLARLAELSRRMEAAKRSPEAAVSYGLIEGMGLTPAEVEKQVLDFFTAKASAVMTNVPGPREPLRLAGVRVGGVIAWAPRTGDMPIGLSIFSYAGEVVVGLSVDAALVPQPETILTGIEEELQALRLLSAPREPASTG
ncbi:MAG: wax ester/triacylglycerol synthase family O-acyltransferase [Frankiaceae bacterium]